MGRACGIAANEASRQPPMRVDSSEARLAVHLHAPGFHNLTKSKTDVDRIVEELMHRDLTKAQRIACLRELAKSGDDVPDELMDEALRKLMERITE